MKKSSYVKVILLVCRYYVIKAIDMYVYNRNLDHEHANDYAIGSSQSADIVRPLAAATVGAEFTESLDKSHSAGVTFHIQI